MTEEQAHFTEVQRFRQWWVVGLVLVPTAIAWIAWVQQIVAGQPFGDDPAPDLVVWGLWLVMGVALPLAVGLIRLETVVVPGEVRVGFPPFPRRVVPTDTILEVQATTIRPVTRWGGYGYRRKRSGGVAFLVAGTDAVRLDLGGGQELVIGTQEPERLATAIAEAGRTPRTG